MPARAATAATNRYNAEADTKPHNAVTSLVTAGKDRQRGMQADRKVKPQKQWGPEIPETSKAGQDGSIPNRLSVAE